MPRKLKVFRMPIGFHDAYVAAPSQKTALEAWGADVDLFARGAAELVEHDELTREPLAHPGEVIRRPRGTTDEHLAALASTGKQPARSRGTKRAPDRSTTHDAAPKRAPAAAKPKPKLKPKPNSKPRPSRARLDAAEAARHDAETRHAAPSRPLRERERTIDRDRRGLRKSPKNAKLARAEERAKIAYDAAMERWRER